MGEAPEVGHGLEIVEVRCAAAQVFGNPWASVRTTSVGIPRIVGVMGATVTECSTATAESRVWIRTGCFLPGVLNA